ncbi:beta-N-acetylhexosaminidase [Ruania alba]|uniref:beta-N-acetylhexosaminidase n=1 Tax=Ruania alba TaxID=648782 RepID=UPI000A95288A|nr:beta-N-acetylhexosaminidase [Ruania alba]
MSERPDLVPAPRQYRPRPGQLTLEGRIGLSTDCASESSATLLTEALTQAGVQVRNVERSERTAVTLRIDSGISASPEGYHIDITTERALITGASADGLARAVQTIRQLLPADALRRAPVGGAPWLPCCEIDDAPRYGWRGVHLDPARHFMPVPFVLRMIDLAALHRLNVVHLHLTDDQGWRLDVPSRPLLAEHASWRTETVIGRSSDFDGTPHGGYYSRADLDEIVEYARRRHITIVPEVDLPGHVQSVLSAYPELGNTGHPVEVRRTWGISENVLAPTEEALAFAKEALDVVIEAFPGPWVHIGGDEVPRTEWRASAVAATRARELGLRTVDALQSWFLRELHAYLAERGRRVVGWDEILDDGGMPTDTIVMAWRGTQPAIAGLTSGHDVVMATNTVTYLDYAASDEEGEPIAQPHTLTLADILDWEPEPPQAADLPGTVLGVQAQLWSEYLPSARETEYAAFPRLCAIAEAGWSAPESRPDLMDRLPAHLRRLDALSVNYRPLTGPRPWQRGGTGSRRRP